MKKTIKIGEKEFVMASSAYTQFKYKNDTGRSLIKDIVSLGEEVEKMDGNNLIDFFERFDTISEKLFKIAYVMITEADPHQANNYDEFLKQLDNYLEKIDWIEEVIELASSPFQGRIQND